MCLWFPYRVGIITAPTSKVGKKSPMDDCILKLIELRKTGEVKVSQFPTGGLSYYPDFLVRNKDINIAHIEGRTSYKEAKASISSITPNMAELADYYIIVDDVVTSGQTLKMCKEILISKGIRPEMIQLFALAKTISTYNY